MTAAIGEARDDAPLREPGLVREDVRVLLVEDDQTVADMYRLKLEIDGYAVTVAPDGESALQLATRPPLPDLVFLDIRLPGIDGLEVLERMRADERTKDLPVVILSNYGEEELVRRGLRLGALEYLLKSQATPAVVSGGVRGWAVQEPTPEPGSDPVAPPIRRAVVESPLPRPRRLDVEPI